LALRITTPAGVTPETLGSGGTLPVLPPNALRATVVVPGAASALLNGSAPAAAMGASRIEMGLGITEKSRGGPWGGRNVFSFSSSLV